MPTIIPPAKAKIHPIILVHAITAAGLHDHYPPDQERVWSPWEMALSDFDRVVLYPNPERRVGEIRYDAIEPALVRPSEIFGVIYKDLISELKHNLSYADTPLQPVYPFTYDWRQDNFVTMHRLAEFIVEVIERTRLMPHDPDKIEGSVCDCVDLIGHSMGGIVIAGCIAAGLVGNGADSLVRRVVTLGTPFNGATTAITKLATGLGTLTGRAAKERERTAARVMPSVYQLLPTFPGALKDGELIGPDVKAIPNASERDIWRTETFQPSIRDTIAEFIQHTRSQRVPKDELDTQTATVFGTFLEAGKQFRDLVRSVDPATMIRPAPEGGWLAIVGAAEKTQISVGVIARDAGTAGKLFDFRPLGFSGEGWNGRETFTGDETVPLQAAIPPWADAWRNTVVVTRKDFEWLGELGDRFLCDQIGLHSAFPLLDLAQRWIINFFRPEWAAKPKTLGQHGKLWGRFLPEFWTTPQGDQALTRAGATEGPALLESEPARKAAELTWSESLSIPGLRLISPG